MTVHNVYAVPGLLMHITLPEGVPVAEQIVITFCDCSAAGPRLVHALQGSTSGIITQHVLQVDNAGDAKAVLQNTSGPTSPFLLVNVAASAATQPQVSIICINTSTLAHSSTHLAAALVSWLQDRQADSISKGTTSPPVVIAAAAVLQNVKETDALTLPIHDAAIPSGLSSSKQLPATTKLQDSFLATLTHCLYVTGLQALCVLVPGHKPSVSAGLQDSTDTVLALGQALTAAGMLPGVTYTAQAVSSLMVLHRWYAEYQDGPGMMYI